MAIKRVRIENLASLDAYVGFSGFWFFDKAGNLIEMGKSLGWNYGHTEQSELAYFDHFASRTTSAQWSIYSGMSTLPEHRDHQNFASLGAYRHNPDTYAQVVFKTPVDHISKFEIDVKPRHDTSIQSVFTVLFFDENDELIAKYEINPKFYFGEKAQYKKITIDTPELNQKKKYCVLSQKENLIVKNFVIHKREKSVIPLYLSDDYDKIVSKLDATQNETTCYVENIFMGYPQKMYQDVTYYRSLLVANGAYHPYISVTFTEPKMLCALEMNTAGIDFNVGINFVVEAFNKHEQKWIELHNYDTSIIPELSFLRVDFENNDFYHTYRVRYLYVGTALKKIGMNNINFIESENLVEEITVANQEDYKTKGMNANELYQTNNLRKLVVQSSKVPFGSGNMYSKRFSIKDNIKSITL
ncbi:hypothetical protein [Paenibacillus agilis]|uniref:Uncharacterized protein n=1 Tax=Paenibacillus agilis TaxID=3020863 RepID=A0A559IEK8_9BACL|nr:hypothetical protein [Paenibacillus agilis]TVX86094.1 hypothetical protein FPZ44_24470 [Paenibacillus agilis]